MSAILREEPPDLSGDEQDRAAGSRADRAALSREEPRGALRLGARRCVRPRGAVGALRAAGRSGARFAPRSGGRRAGSRSRRAILATAIVCGAGRWLAAQRAANRRRPRSTSSPSAAARFGRRASPRTARRSCTRRPGTENRMEIFVGRPESPEITPVRTDGRGRPRDLEVGRDGRVADRFLAGGFRRTGTLAQLAVAGGGRRARFSKASSGPTGRPTARVSPSYAAARGKMRLEYPARQGALRDGRLDRPLPRFSREASGSLSSTIRRRATTEARSPSSTVRPRKKALGALCLGAGSRVVARRVRSGSRPREVGGNRAIHSTTLDWNSPRARSGPGCAARSRTLRATGACSYARYAPERMARAPAGRFEGARSRPGSTGRCPPHFSGRQEGPLFAKRGRAAAPATPSTSEAPTGRRPCASARAAPRISPGRRVGARDPSPSVGPAARRLPHGSGRAKVFPKKDSRSTTPAGSPTANRHPHGERAGPRPADLVDAEGGSRAP